MRHYKCIAGVIILFLCVSLFNSCKDDDTMMWIASERVLSEDPVSTQEFLRMQYKFKESDPWMVLSERINGFNYEEGYEYILRVKVTKIKNPAQDQSGTSYSLVDIISKTKKESNP